MTSFKGVLRRAAAVGACVALIGAAASPGYAVGGDVLLSQGHEVYASSDTAGNRAAYAVNGDLTTYAVRWVRTVRSECLDWTLIWHQRQLYRVLTEYLRHYNTVRPHRSLDLTPPRPALRLTTVQPDLAETAVHRVDVLGGRLHEYEHRRAA